MGRKISIDNRDRFLELGITISMLRKLKGMSQEELAERAGISRSHLSAIEAPNMVYPFSLDILFHIADALEIKPGDLLNMRLTIPEHQDGTTS